MTDLAALRRAQYDDHVHAHLPNPHNWSAPGATGQPVDLTPEYAPIVPQPDLHPHIVDSPEVVRLRHENTALRHELEEFRYKPHTDAAFQQAVEEEFVGRRLDQELHPVPRETGSQIALAEALIVLAQSGGMDAASAHTAARLISDMIRY